MSVANKKSKSKYIHFAVVLALMFLFRFIPPIGTITPYGMAIIGIFIGLIYGWSVDADNLIWTSLLALVALGVTDFGTAGQAIAQAFGNESVMLMLLGMFFLGMLQDSHLTEWFSNKLLGAKFVAGHPWLLTAFIVLAPAYLSILVNQTLVALIMFVVYQSVFEQAGYKKGDLYPAMVLMGFMLICSFAFSLFPFRGWCLMTVGMATKSGIAINMGGWMISEVVTLLVASVGCIVISFGAGAEGFRAVLKGIGVYGWVVFLIALAMIWKVDGEPVLNKKTAPGYFYWDLILVVASAMVVAGQITSQAAGITPAISQLLRPLFGLPSYTFLLALGLITFIATNFANNVAVTITMMTIAMTMATQVDFNLQVALMVITVYGVIGLLTPAGSVNGAMIHAHEFTTTKSAYISGIIMLIFGTIIMALVLIPLGLKFMV